MSGAMHCGYEGLRPRAHARARAISRTIRTPFSEAWPQREVPRAETARLERARSGDGSRGSPAPARAQGSEEAFIKALEYSIKALSAMQFELQTILDEVRAAEGGDSRAN